MNSHAHPHPDTRFAQGPAEHEPYAPPRRHWPGVLAALAVAAVVALVAVNSTDQKDTVPAAPLITEPTAAGPANVSPTSEQTADRLVEDTSRVIVTEEQPVDVSTPPVEDRAPAQ